ncbi:hypothetical protein [Botrimarina sp.]|uniref:hypothetical protein n=1 Tax=Botrimarina sp. TaxID=2795802 RepID=UPI0032EC1165
MSHEAQDFIAGFDSLPAPSQHEVAVSILRRFQFADTPATGDEELVQIADEVFLAMDRDEQSDGS